MVSLILAFKFVEPVVLAYRNFFDWGSEASAAKSKTLEASILLIVSFTRDTFDAVAEEALAGAVLAPAPALLRGPPPPLPMAITDYLAVLAVRDSHFVGRSVKVVGEVLAVLTLEVGGRTLGQQERDAVCARKHDLHCMRLALEKVVGGAASTVAFQAYNFSDASFVDPRNESGNITTAPYIVEDWAAQEGP
ncbi:hypothetical protein HKX48_000872 [Thoreauomyces humboldtii]|nr:hypothetical protein HKX48_000872 [Thoreauomyces humboldtii]